MDVVWQVVDMDMDFFRERIVHDRSVGQYLSFSPTFSSGFLAGNLFKLYFKISKWINFFLSSACKKYGALRLRFPFVFLLLMLPLSACMHLPKPAGPFNVGTQTLELTDSSRLETYTQAQGDFRKLSIKFWYPTRAGGQAEKTEGYFLGTTYSLPKAEILSTQWKLPLVIYSHDLNGNHSDNIHLFEELASFGYVVAAIDHSYLASSVRFSDGQVIRFAQPDTRPSPYVETRGMPIFLQTLYQDVQFVVSQLKVLNQTEKEQYFYRALSLKRIGMIGAGWGGLNTALTMNSDNRILAGLNIGGQVYGDAALKTVIRPYMEIYSNSDAQQVSETIPYNMYGSDKFRKTSSIHGDTNDKAFFDNAVAAYHLRILGSEPEHFDSERFVSTFSTRADPGIYKTTKVVDAFTKSFFDQYLKGRKKPFVEMNVSQFPEARVDYHVRYQKLSSLGLVDQGRGNYLGRSPEDERLLKALRASQKKIRKIRPYNAIPIKAIVMPK